MSPVDQSRAHVGQAAIVALVGVVVLLLAAGAFAILNRNTKSSDLRLGDQTFQGGSAERLAKEIARRGPIFYGDVSGNKERDIILQHLGDDVDEGWYAFRAAPANKPRDCTWEWQADEELFRAKCDESLTAPADGEGLQRYPVKVRDGRLDVDLNAEARQAEATTTTGG
ncbi:MAG: hypothetical protein R2701_09815 [Acidimicrobiales bacterium]